MSASREKKQRRDADAPILSSRAQEEQAKAEKRRRNTIVYTIIGIVAVILVAILLIWDSGIIQRNTTVATVDGEKVTAPQVAYYYYNNQVIKMAQVYAQWGISGYPFDATTSPKEQVITEDAVAELGIDEEYVDKTYHEYFLDSALNYLKREHTLLDAAKEAGYTLSDEGKAVVEEAMEALDSTIESYMSTYGVSLSRTAYLQMIYGDSMTERSYRTCMTNAQLADEFYAEYFDSLTDYSDEELTAYYEENRDSLDTFTYYYRNFSGLPETTDEDGNTITPTEEETEAAMAAAEEAANAALAEYQANPDLDTLESNEDFSVATGLLSTPTAYYYDWMVDAERQAGDATVLDNGVGYSLVIFADRYLEEDPTTADVRHILISAMAEDDPDTEDVNESTEAPTDEAFAAAKQTALDLLEQWKAGEATEESFAALANEYSADPGSNTNGGLYENVSLNGSYIAAFTDWCLDPARVSGDVSDPIQNTGSDIQGWHLIYFVDWNEPVWKTTARAGIWLNDLKANVEITRTDKLEAIFE